MAMCSVSPSFPETFPVRSVEWLFAVADKTREALNVARQFSRLSEQSYVDFYTFATLYDGRTHRDWGFVRRTKTQTASLARGRFCCGRWEKANYSSSASKWKKTPFCS
jgi:hypothetical protein